MEGNIDFQLIVLENDNVFIYVKHYGWVLSKTGKRTLHERFSSF